MLYCVFDLKVEIFMHAGSNSKYWFKCSAGPDHEWEATLSNRTSGGTGCPYCLNRKVSITNSLASVYPHIAKLWHPTRNGDLRPEDVVFGTRKIFWWLDDGIEFQFAVRNMTLQDRKKFFRVRRKLAGSI
jgi:hypothetical protein